VYHIIRSDTYFKKGKLIMDNKKTSKSEQKKELKALSKKDSALYNSEYLFRENCENDIHTDPQGSWTGVPFDDPYDKPIQDADDL